MTEVQFTLSDGLKIAALQYGSTAAPLKVIAVHGWLDNAATWSLVMPLVIQALPSTVSAHVLAIDFSGHGKSDHRAASSHHTPALYFSEVVEVADQLGWKQFGLIGHSMGGAVASMLSGALPSRILFCAAVEALGSAHEDDPNEAPARMERYLNERARLVTRKPRVYSSTDEMIKRSQETNPDISAAALRVLHARSVKATPDGAGFVFCHDPRLVGTTSQRPSQEQVMAFLRRVTCPVVLFWSDRRWYSVDEESQRRKKEAIANFRQIDVTGGHHPHLEKPEQFVDPFVQLFVTAFGAVSSPSSESKL